MLLSSCGSSGVYINKAYLNNNNIDGKTLAVLPADVYYSGKQPRKEDWYEQEQTASQDLQFEVQQALLDFKNVHTRRDKQYPVVLMDAYTVNKTLLTKMADLRTAWTMPPDSVGRMLGADLVIKVRMDREHFMSQSAATWTNIGLTVLSGALSAINNGYPPEVEYVKANNFDYEISLISTATGDTISRYAINPRNRDDITGVNHMMASKSVVFAGK
ncbi:hypothetical protein BC343_25100 [Mucilaginibacter pedocola]|uniref:Uncharacterized protein n=2 Tax=Mucilaginibacter pedocola TaxID=1792845 RepID=A0A1S9PJ16_9SPHI|nr:hypothetical protein BC343_25100 [Mucilaginibacter pedocola]